MASTYPASWTPRTQVEAFMLVYVLSRIPRRAGVSTAARLRPAAAVPDLTVTTLLHGLHPDYTRAKMLGVSAITHRRFLHDACTDQSTARRWRDQ